MSAHTENITDAFNLHHAEGINTTINKFSPELIEERIRFNLKPSNAQIYTRIQFLKQLIRNNSVKTTSTAAPVLIVRNQDPYTVEKLEPLEPCHAQYLEVRNSRPTFKVLKPRPICFFLFEFLLNFKISRQG